MLNHKMIVTGLARVVLAAVVTISLLGCAEFRKLASKAGTYDGPSKAIGEGRGHAFITLDANGGPTAIGVRMSEAALLGLPAEPPRNADGWEYVLSLPKEAAIAGYNHVVIDWNPKGHIPPGVYDAPHFDFHFYLINVKEPNLRASVILTPSPATCNKATLIRQRLRLESARSRV